MPHVRLDRFLGEEESLTDLTVDQPVGNELEDLDLARRRLLLELSECRRRCERDHGSGPLGVPARGSRLEATAVVAVPVQDLPTLRGVHAMRIGAGGIAL